MRRKSIFLFLVITGIILFSSIPVFAVNLPCFASGQDPNSALTNIAISTPAVTSITVSWSTQAGDIGVIEYQDVNHITLPLSTITMTSTTGSATVKPPTGAASNTLILGTGTSYGMRYIWYSSITYSNGTVETFPAPYGVTGK